MDLGISYLERPCTDYVKHGFFVYVRHNYIERMVMKKNIYAHTPPYGVPKDHNVELDLRADGYVPESEIPKFSVSMKEASEIEAIDYKFSEGKLIEEFKRYVDSTYNQHYAKEKFQATEFIVDGGHGTGFCIGNVLKYAQRYGKKGTHDDARKDIMKVLHYALIQLHVHDNS